jgi:hypothetical protein
MRVTGIVSTRKAAAGWSGVTPCGFAAVLLQPVNTKEATDTKPIAYKAPQAFLVMALISL